MERFITKLKTGIIEKRCAGNMREKFLKNLHAFTDMTSTSINLIITTEK